MVKKIVLDERAKVLIIGVAVATVALVLSLNIFSLYNRRAKDQTSKIAEEKKRLALRKDIAGIDNSITSYRGHLYGRTDESSLRQALSDLARAAGVDIISIQPLEAQKFGDYRKIAFRLGMLCSYDQLGKFVESLEKLKQLTIVDEISLDAKRSYEDIGKRSTAFSEKVTRAEATLVVSAYTTES